MAEPTTSKVGDHRKWLFLPSCFPLLVTRCVLVHGVIPLQRQDFPFAVMMFRPTHFSSLSMSPQTILWYWKSPTSGLGRHSRLRFPAPQARTLPPLLWAQPGLRALIQDQQFHRHLRDLLTRCLALTNEDPAGNEKLKAPFDLELLMEVVRGRWALLAGNARCGSPHPAMVGVAAPESSRESSSHPKRSSRRS